MEVALGVLGWTPDTFWSATYREFSNAWAGKARMEGWGPFRRPTGQIGEPWTEAQVANVRQAMEDHKRMWPDGKLPKAVRLATAGTRQPRKRKRGGSS